VRTHDGSYQHRHAYRANSYTRHPKPLNDTASRWALKHDFGNVITFFVRAQPHTHVVRVRHLRDRGTVGRPLPLSSSKNQREPSRQRRGLWLALIDEEDRARSSQIIIDEGQADKHYLGVHHMTGTKPPGQPPQLS
jgi:hypothetical protein